MCYRYNEDPCSQLQESGVEEGRKDFTAKHVEHSFSCLCFPRGFYLRMCICKLNTEVSLNVSFSVSITLTRTIFSFIIEIVYQIKTWAEFYWLW